MQLFVRELPIRSLVWISRSPVSIATRQKDQMVAIVLPPLFLLSTNRTTVSFVRTSLRVTPLSSTVRPTLPPVLTRIMHVLRKVVTARLFSNLLFTHSLIPSSPFVTTTCPSSGITDGAVTKRDTSRQVSIATIRLSMVRNSSTVYRSMLTNKYSTLSVTQCARVQATSSRVTPTPRPASTVTHCSIPLRDVIVS